MTTAVRVRVLGRVEVDDADRDQAVGRGQARELLALLAGRRGAPLTTGDVVDALWPEHPPATATTIVHGLVRRLRAALGAEAVVNDAMGYRLELPADAVDLWALVDAVAAGDHQRARGAWREPVFGVYHDRAWARAALAELDQLRGLTADATGLPRGRQVAPVTRLVGRRRELAAVAAATKRSRLVTIVGLGGVGKSRLALEAASESGRPPGEVAHVDLGTAVGPAISRVATDLGVTASGEPQWDLRTVTSVIGARRLLLLLDGCEHEHAGAAAAVEALLAACPGLVVLATSRVALGVPGEHVVPLVPFADPGDPRGHAVELLIDRAEALGLTVGPDDRARLAAISARTAGVPLALELAVTEAVFGSAHDAAPAPQAHPEQALSEVVQQSIGGLTAAASTAARRTALLVHGFTPALLAAVCPQGSSPPGVLHELLASGLVSAQLAGLPRRLRFLDPIRRRLVEEEAAAGPNGAALAAVADAVAGVLRAVRPDLAGPTVPSAIEPAVAELPNTEALVEQLGATGDHRGALRLAVAGVDAWYEAGGWARGTAVTSAALAAVRPDPCPPGLPAGAVDAAAAPVDPVDWAWGAWAVGCVGATYEANRREYDRMLVAADVTRTAGLPVLEAHLRLRLALGAGYRRDMAAAGTHLARLRELVERLDSDYGRLMASHAEALAPLVLGDPARAATELQAVAERAEALGAPADAARSWRLLALARRALGDVAGALGALDRAEGLALEGRSRGTLATIRTDVADLRVQHGDVDRQVLLDALDTVLTVGNLRAAGLLRLQLGAVDADPVQLAEAALDLWESDRAWAAVAVARLVELLPRSHPLVRLAPAAVAALRRDWGSPLGAREAELVERTAGRADDPPPASWAEDLHQHLRGVVTAARSASA